MGEYLSTSVRWAFASKNSLPPRKGSEVFADLHAHPCIKDDETLRQTLDACVAHDVGLLACTAHTSELSFWRIKDIAKKAKRYDIEDKGLALSFSYKGKNVTFVPAYETRCLIEGVGTMHVVALMPNQGYMPSDRKPFKECHNECRTYNAIVIAAHPYLVCDPDKPRVHVANAKERDIICETVFPYVEAADAISAAGLWLMAANEHLVDDYARWIATSDAHGTTPRRKREIGRAGTVFTLGNWSSGDDLRERLRSKLQYGSHTPHLRYMPFSSFIGVCVQAFQTPWHPREPVDSAQREQTF